MSIFSLSGTASGYVAGIESCNFTKSTFALAFAQVFRKTLPRSAGPRTLPFQSELWQLPQYFSKLLLPRSAWAVVYTPFPDSALIFRGECDYGAVSGQYRSAH